MMKISISTGGYARNNVGYTVDFVREVEKLGIDCVWSAEAWGQDAVTAVTYLAAHTKTIKHGTGIIQISTRVPSMIAMTALSLAALTGGRFIIGRGASGPQVVDGLHGVPNKAPFTPLRETVDIVRMACRGEKLDYQGKHYVVPLPGGEGKSLKLDLPPAEVPIYLATLGPKSLEYTGAAADGWLGTSFSPDHAEAHLQYLRKGAESAGRTLDDIHLNASCNVSIGDNVEALIDARRPSVAFSMGAMGSANTNFYNDAFQRAGFADDALAIQQLWLDGKRREAVARVPDEMITRFGAIGTPEMIRERFRLYRSVGIDGLNIRLDSDDNATRIAQLEQVMDIAANLD
jgi:F420-dependent oxidoreductase-like protein